ncbi:MAG: SCO1 protein [Verrucomicrobia subdivision 3 bacterium]|nr:SCO1 protein [Limisphaerales bacterium]MCS1415118.1 SCO1 protein [Limisphaerales bacterium]
MKSGLISIITLATIFLIAGCALSEVAEQPVVPPEETASEASREFQVRGVIKEIPDAGTKIRIQHEAIPEYMPAMTMPFNVKDRAEFADVQVGDTVSFTLHVTSTKSWIDQIKTAESGLFPDQMPSINSFRQVREVETLKVGDPLPNYPFTNQDNKAVRLADFKGKVLVFTFIYTRCPLPDFCPRMSMHFRTAYETLKKDPEAPDNWHLLSITFDPAFDIPEVLRNYAKAFSSDPEKWSFLTGEMIKIDAITEQFGLMFSRSRESAINWDHTLRTVIIDPQGRIHKIYIGNTWTPESLVADIKIAAQQASDAKDEEEKTDEIPNKLPQI